MKRSKLVIIALLCMLVQFATPAQGQRKSGQEAPKKGGKPIVITAADASSNSFWTKEITEAELQNAVVQSGRFSTLSDDARQRMVKELKFAQSDLADPSKAVQAGKALSADFIIIGKCLNAEEKDSGFSFGRVNTKSKTMNVAVQFQLINAESGQIVDSKEYTGKKEASSGSVAGVGSNSSELPRAEAYREMVKGFAADFVGRMSLSIPIEALVVLVRGNQVAIDAGSNASVREGMEFEIFTEGEPIKNAAGEVLDYDRSVHGRIRVVRVEPKIAYADLVETYNESGQRDSAPNPARIKRDYSVVQLGLNTPSPRKDERADKPKDKDKEKKDGLLDGVKKKKLPF